MSLNRRDLASWGGAGSPQDSAAVANDEKDEHAFRLGQHEDGNIQEAAFDFDLADLTAGVSVDIGKDITGEIIACLLEIMVLVVAGGTSAKVGVGPVADPDKYGLTGDLLKNSKITNQIATGTAGVVTAEDIQVNMVTAAGAIGDTAATAGRVRGKLIYRELNAYANTP